MPIASLNALFDALIRTTTTTEVREILAGVGDYADVAMDEEFGPLKLSWHAFDDNISNFSSIGLGSKSGRSLTERLTNAMDAILEARAPVGVPLPESSRAAAKAWFNRPVSGPDEGLFKWNFSDHDYDRLIAVVLSDSDRPSAATIDVLDRGIGIAPERFADTILSLQRGNKMDKRHLIGAFGQGGAATLAFSDYAVIISRHKDRPNIVAFTVVRVINLSDRYKEDAFAYLSMSSAGNRTVPWVDIGPQPLSIYPPCEGVKRLPELSHGTVIRHVGYKLPNLDGALGPGVGNLYHYLHTSMFDPLFPFRLIDLRDGKGRDELITGSRNRLMTLVRKKDEGKEQRTEIKHYRSMEYVSPYGTEENSIGIEYWVAFNYRKPAKGKGTDLILRPSSGDLFVQHGHPVVGSLNGQNQGEATMKLLRDASLGMVAKHIVVHIDATNASSRVRRELFVTNREGFKEGDVLTDLMRVLQRMLQEDEELYRLERELTERLTQREAESTNQEVVEQITKLLLDSGLRVEKPGVTQTKGQGDTAPVPTGKRPRYRFQDPLPTLPYPSVTRFEIVTPRPTLQVALNDHELVLVETDADAEFDRLGKVAIRAEPGALEQLGKAPLRGGRVRWRLRPSAGAAAGATGRIVVSITKPDGSQLTDEIGYLLLPAKDEKSKKEEGLVPPFEVLPVDPDDAETWLRLWPDLDDGTSPEKLGSVAYKQERGAGKIIVRYSTIFAPYVEMVQKLTKESPALAPLFETSYKVWIGYHAILQEQARSDIPEGVDDATADRLLEEDRARVARMQVKQALQTANLRHQLLKAQGQAD